MGLMKPRVSSYVDRGNELIAKGKTKQAMNLVSHGLQYYSERVIDSISPYAKNDAGLIVLVLRHLADEVEKNNPGAKELAAGIPPRQAVLYAGAEQRVCRYAPG